MHENEAKYPEKPYLIEAGNRDYWCDYYFIYPNCIEAIYLKDDYIDVFAVYDTVLAIHDFSGKETLATFIRSRKKIMKELKGTRDEINNKALEIQKVQLNKKISNDIDVQ